MIDGQPVRKAPIDGRRAEDPGHEAERMQGIDRLVQLMRDDSRVENAPAVSSEEGIAIADHLT